MNLYNIILQHVSFTSLAKSHIHRPWANAFPHALAVSVPSTANAPMLVSVAADHFLSARRRHGTAHHQAVSSISRGRPECIVAVRNEEDGQDSEGEGAKEGGARRRRVQRTVHWLIRKKISILSWWAGHLSG